MHREHLSRIRIRMRHTPAALKRRARGVVCASACACAGPREGCCAVTAVVLVPAPYARGGTKRDIGQRIGPSVLQSAMAQLVLLLCGAPVPAAALAADSAVTGSCASSVRTDAESSAGWRAVVHREAHTVVCSKGSPGNVYMRHSQHAYGGGQRTHGGQNWSLAPSARE